MSPAKMPGGSRKIPVGSEALMQALQDIPKKGQASASCGQGSLMHNVQRTYAWRCEFAIALATCRRSLDRTF